jgi:L-asparaginase
LEKILIINTGGTFNKIYNSIKGELEVPSDDIGVTSILKYFYNLDYEIKNIIHKDSLEITNSDREEIVELIANSSKDKILIIHGTDTMDKTATYIQENIEDKTVILTGAMVPVSIDSVEASSNLSMAIGYLLGCTKQGVYIAMHGLVDTHQKVYKDREVGVFKLSTCKGL